MTHFIHLDQSHAAAAIGAAHLGGVAAGRQLDQQGGVFAADRERKCADQTRGADHLAGTMQLPANDANPRQ
jgi:hypothetical protein